MKKITIKNIEETEKLAQQIASQFKGGEVVALIGNLSVGKTTFTQFLAKELGVKDVVNSPTFNIIKIYSILSLRGTNLPAGGERRGNPVINNKNTINQLVHIDAYRLNSPEELEALGVKEYFNDKNIITIIEWADKVKSILPTNSIIINIVILKNQKRSFQIERE